jgi:hypothetical protein
MDEETQGIAENFNEKAFNPMLYEMLIPGWVSQETDQETYKRLLGIFYRETVIDTSFLDKKIKNGRMLEILEKLFSVFVEEIHQEHGLE